jgi:hypothetical protein
MQVISIRDTLVPLISDSLRTFHSSLISEFQTQSCSMDQKCHLRPQPHPYDEGCSIVRNACISV